MDRGYIDIAQYKRLTDEGVCYVNKMKKNLKYERLCSGYFSAAHHICHSRMQSWLDRKEEAD